MHRTFCLVVAIYALPTQIAFADDRPSAKELLDRYEKAVARLSRVHIESVEKYYQKGDSDGRFKDNPDDPRSTEELTLFRDNSRWRILQRSTSRRTIQEKATDAKTSTETLIGEQLLYVSRAEALPSPGNVRVQAYLDATTDEADVYRRLGSRDMLFGVTYGDHFKPLWNVMRDASSLEVAPEMEVIGTVKTYVVKSQGRFGAHTLWLDPTNDCLPRRIEIHKRPGDTFDDFQLGVKRNPPELPPATKRQLPPIPTLNESFWKWDNIHIERKNDIPVITAFEMTRKSKFEKDVEIQSRIEYRITSVDFDLKVWPENAFQLSIEIPEGTAVFVRDVPVEERNSYVWMNGKVQKRTGQ